MAGPRHRNNSRRKCFTFPCGGHGAESSADAAAEALMAGFAEEMLADYPENATGLGIDKGKRAALKSRLTDRSVEGQRAIAERVAKRLERLKAIDPAALGEATRIDVDVMRTAHGVGFRTTATPPACSRRAS